jgi:hypothetical protein
LSFCRKKFRNFLKKGNMRRIKHAVIGMAAGWLALQLVVTVTLLVMVAMELARGGARIGQWGFYGYFLAIFAACSAVVCLVAWLLIYLPVYWHWPRDGGFLGHWIFIAIGAASGAGIGLIYLAVVRLPSPIAASIVIVLPAVVGGIGAWVGWWREEKERRFLEWQQQVTNPVFE